MVAADHAGCLEGDGAFGGALDGWNAVEEFFGLDSSDAEALFHPHEYNMRDRKDPLAVADRIMISPDATVPFTFVTWQSSTVIVLVPPAL